MVHGKVGGETDEHLLALLVEAIGADILPKEWEAFEASDEAVAPTCRLLFVSVRLAVHEMPESHVLPAAGGNEILAILIR